MLSLGTYYAPAFSIGVPAHVRTKYIVDDSDIYVGTGKTRIHGGEVSGT